ncbi:MAG: hypothetical protein C4589_00175 [Peptococcaceae bacterium]|jgi:hypothetical protein|nr:MAG: hypothetical protein C4589_00175 [Peptococcaceae bacterium]
MQDKMFYKTLWKIRRYADDLAFERGESYKESEVEGNLLLNEGITVLQNLLTGGGGTAFNNANSYIGVGDSATAAAASQDGLQAATNKAYVAMEATYPQIAGQTTTWRAVFGSAVGNFDWNEFTVANGNSDAAGNLNRKVSGQGTKAAGQTWTVDVAITWS